ncbi:MAG: thiol reductant ABC exporter subunit CydD [Francisellaceae bacterium]
MFIQPNFSQKQAWQYAQSILYTCAIIIPARDTMSAATSTEKKQARSWLSQLARPAKKWIQLTVFISFISGLLLILQLWLLAHISYAAYIEKLSRGALIGYFMAILMLVFVRAILAYVKERVAFQAAAMIKRQLRMDIIHHINRLGAVKSSSKSSGELISAAMEQVEGVNNFLMYFLPQVTLSGLMPLAILAFIFPQSWVSGLILLICAPLIPLFMVLVGLGAESENQKQFKSLARMSSKFLDTLQGLVTIRLFNRNAAHAKAIFDASDQYRIKTMKVLRIAFLSSAVLEVFSAASIALVAIYLGMGFINAGTDNHLWWALDNITLQGGLFILLLAPEFFLPLRELSTHYHAKAEAVGAALELQKLFELRPAQTPSVILLNEKVKRIVFSDVSLCYENKQIPSLKGIDIEIEAGQKIAIVGESGAGKSSLLNLLLQLVEPTSGQIRVNDHNLNELDEPSWISKISWLGQNATLFQGSIRSNLLLAKPDALDEELWQALHVARLKEVVLERGGLDSEIGEKAQGLSGGQAQRLALARAYLKPCEVLLLDEPTASIDKENEALIKEALSEIWQPKTVVILTHRLAMLDDVDKVIVLEDGVVTEQGCPKEMLGKTDGYFSRIQKCEKEEWA